MSGQVNEVSFISGPGQIAKMAGAPVRMIETPKKWLTADAPRHTDTARQIVVDNYNDHHDTSKTPPLTVELVSVLWFTKMPHGWKAVLGSSVLKGLHYEITYDDIKKETCLEVYKKINTVKIPE